MVTPVKLPNPEGGLAGHRVVGPSTGDGDKDAVIFVAWTSALTCPPSRSSSSAGHPGKPRLPSPLP